jgi:hypothetical protein
MAQSLNCSAPLHPYLQNTQHQNRKSDLKKTNSPRLFTTAAASSSPTAKGDTTKPSPSRKSNGVVKMIRNSLGRCCVKLAQKQHELGDKLSCCMHLWEATANSAVSSSCSTVIDRLEL